jgi:hypothetical protein
VLCMGLNHASACDVSWNHDGGGGHMLKVTQLGAANQYHIYID